jgi:uncharacterized protein YjlB
MIMEKPAFMKYRDVEYIVLKDDGRFPNNERLPLIVYKNAVRRNNKNVASTLEDLFSKNSWGKSWRNGIYTTHHYHSTAHEVLGVYDGTATVQLGGETGVVCDIGQGDVVVIPAGVAHRNVCSSGDFRVVGAYPEGQMWDMCYGENGERPRTEINIVQVPTPSSDPVLGAKGPLLGLWSKLQ